MILVDSADLELVKPLLELPFIDGFTTNPALMAKAACTECLELSQYINNARALCKLNKKSSSSEKHTLMIQGVGKPEAIISQTASYLNEIRSAGDRAELWIKLMPSKESLELVDPINQLGARTLITAVFTVAQALAALRSGASGIAVYFGRLMRLDENWSESMTNFREIFKNSDKLLLLASFRDLTAVQLALKYSHNLTLPPELVSAFLDSPHTDEAERSFSSKVRI